MATRIPPAARQLIAEVEQAERGDVSWTTVGEADGLRRYRTIAFAEQHAWLAPLLNDKRIKESHVNDDGELEVTFVSDVRADRIQSFGVVGAKKVLDEKDEPKPAAKKPAAKKAAKRPAKKAAKKS